MAENFRLLDVAIGELAANLNALSDDPWQVISQDYYGPADARRVTVLLGRPRLQVPAGVPIDPRILRRN